MNMYIKNVWYSQIGVALLLLFSGCATQGINTMKYTESNYVKVINEKIYPIPQEAAWDIVVKDLSRSFYVINNIDKASRIINISFYTDTPQDYIECGKSIRTYTQGDKVETYEYDTASSVKFKFATPIQTHPAFANYVIVNRTTSMEGRSNIYIAPVESDKNNTLITVNTRYILSMKFKGLVYAEHFSGAVNFLQNVPEETNVISFNTAEVGKRIDNDGTVMKCFSKGTLENKILDMITY